MRYIFFFLLLLLSITHINVIERDMRCKRRKNERILSILVAVCSCTYVKEHFLNIKQIRSNRSDDIKA